ncbi:uncharacterized protein EV154DRAFT_480928 [Mucor mucedo]|uniref:uncharacterized protein n=1 Tax=Mucor mucedo TaxID=29922 RepID=UPI00221FE3EE|nr:uncharacterized protein EV154DRAFT_480928 [Mucor mucedo]KAI7891722.1 hypothetical protein EV154DRAFT_480928 [Mucor mucedo]
MGTLTSIVNLFKFTTYNLCSCSVLHELKSKNYFIESEKKCKIQKVSPDNKGVINDDFQLSNFTFVCVKYQLSVYFHKTVRGCDHLVATSRKHNINHVLRKSIHDSSCMKRYTFITLNITSWR